uniref:Uncharacterized protein n=1 Tax=Schistocephalus solidus TaxID=70667 RepID=A0A0X3PU85_SCHSO
MKIHLISKVYSSPRNTNALYRFNSIECTMEWGPHMQPFLAFNKAGLRASALTTSPLLIRITCHWSYQPIYYTLLPKPISLITVLFYLLLHLQLTSMDRGLPLVHIIPFCNVYYCGFTEKASVNRLSLQG